MKIMFAEIMQKKLKFCGSKKHRENNVKKRKHTQALKPNNSNPSMSGMGFVQDVGHWSTAAPKTFFCDARLWQPKKEQKITREQNRTVLRRTSSSSGEALVR
jgi:hypothetical protein